jgi:hypothetical protein
MARRYVISALVGLLGVFVLVQPAAARPSVSRCTGRVKIASFDWQPNPTAAGDSAIATVAAQNCKNNVTTVSVEWLGQYSAPGGGFPAGCPVIDPVSTPLTLQAKGEASAQLGFSILPGCSATALTETVRLSLNGTVLATASATLMITQPPQTTTTAP